MTWYSVASRVVHFTDVGTLVNTTANTILGGPGGVSGGGGDLNGREKKFGRRKVEKDSFSRPFRLFLAPTNCPWVFEDVQIPETQNDLISHSVSDSSIDLSLPMLLFASC